MDDKKTIAVFDFDGTITKKDTFLDFLFFTFGFWKVAIKSIPFVIIYPLFLIGIIKRGWFKEKVFLSFFAGFSEGKFNELCRKYAKSKTLFLLRGRAINKIRWHKKNQHGLVIVSASIENLIIEQAKTVGIEKVIAIIPEIIDNKLTGKFKTPNCWGKEKVKRFKEQFPNWQDYEIYGYGDSRGDKELLELATHKFFKKF